MRVRFSATCADAAAGRRLGLPLRCRLLHAGCMSAHATICLFYGCCRRLAGHDMANLDMGGPLIFMALLGFAHLLVRGELVRLLQFGYTQNGYN